jgi:large subunit ribosomal protein L21
MFAVVDIAGFQEIVREGDTLRIPHRSEEKGKKVKVETVLMVVDGDKVTFGAPFVPNASIELTIDDHGQGDKVRVVKTMRRKRYKRVHGHRQPYSDVTVSGISFKK